MELNLLVNLLYKNRWLLASMTIFVALVLYAIGILLPPRYEAFVELFISRSSEEAPIETFDYEGYYGTLAARDDTDTIKGFFESTSLMSKALADTGGNINVARIEDLRDDVVVQKKASNVIRVSIRGTSASQVEKTLSLLMKAVNAEVSTLREQKDAPQIAITSLTDKPFVKDISYPPLMLGILGACVGLIGGVFLISLREYYLSQEVQA